MKEGKFFTNPATGQWDCKYCQKSGNIYQFIREFHNQWFNYTTYTTEEQYADLSSRRKGISPSTFEKYELAYCEPLGEWLLPAYSSTKDEINNLYVYRTHYDSVDECEIERVLSGPFFKQLPFGMHLLSGNKKHPIWVAEGQWDCMALYEVLSKLGTAQGKLSDLHDIVGLPGAGTHPKEHLGIFESRTVHVCMDNDNAGIEGTKRFINTVSAAGSLPIKLLKLEWPASTENGYDVRDLCNKFPRAGGAMTAIKKNLSQVRIEAKGIISEGYNPDVEPVGCDSFETLWGEIERELHTTEAMYDSLAVAMAISTSLNLGDVPLWAFLVGPASSGKSTISAILESAGSYSFSVSKLTGIFSGYKAKDGKDKSILPKIQGKTMYIKDFTTVLTSPQMERDRVFGDLRDLYDGAGSAQYRNDVKRDYKGVRFGIVACVTDAIHAYNQTGLGERFLKCSSSVKSIRCGMPLVIWKELVVATVVILIRLWIPFWSLYVMLRYKQRVTYLVSNQWRGAFLIICMRTPKIKPLLPPLLVEYHVPETIKTTLVTFHSWLPWHVLTWNVTETKRLLIVQGQS
jgi:hypothetical protein